MGDMKSFRRVSDGRYGGSLQADLCSRIGARLTKDMTVLEIGCGAGQMTLPLCGGVSLWEATDPSEALIEKAQRLPHSDRLRFSVMDPASLPYEHSGFDAVVAVNVLQNLPKTDPVLRELRRVLRPGGILFAPTYMLGGRRAGAADKTRGTEARRWTATEFIGLIERYGFAVEKAVLLPGRAAPLCYLEAMNQK